MKIISIYAGILKFGIIHRGTNIYLSEKHERGHVMDHLLLVSSAVTGCILLLFMLKKCKLRFGLLSACTGIAALFAADLICGFFNFNLPMNAFSLCVSAIGGIPGVILLNIFTVLFL